MIGIQVALEAEASAILAALEQPRSEGRLGRTLRCGKLAGQDVAVAISGVGKVAAAHTAALLAADASAVLVIGTSGSLHDAVDPGHLVVATHLLQHDLDARPLFSRWEQPDLGISRFPCSEPVTRALLAAADSVVAAGYPPEAAAIGVSAPRRHDGLVISGDAFISSAEVSARLRQDLPDALACDMESAAVAQVCTMAGVPFGAVRTISDRSNGQASVDFVKFLALAAPLHLALAVSAIESLAA
jgi:adenosylhomocysteine nucleosidase